MPVVSSAPCARCGAPLSIELHASKQVCKFCHHEQIVAPQAQPSGPPPGTAPFQGAPPFPQTPFPPPAPFPQGPIPLRPVSVPSAGATPLLPLIALVGVLALGGAVIAISRGGSTRGASGSGPGAGGVTPPGERLQWGPPNGRSVVPVKIDADATEDFVGLYRLLQLGEQTTTPVFVGGFSGADFKRVWRAGPYGDLSESAGATRMAVVGNRVVVTDFRAQAHVLDVTTGRELRSVPLSDKAQRLCPVLESPRKIWIMSVDQKGVRLDVETGQLEPGPEPAGCPTVFDRACSAARAQCRAPDHRGADPLANSSAPPIPTLDGMSAQMLLTEGSLSVAVGQKSPGTAVPMAFGFETGKSSLSWKVVIPADPTMAGHSSDAIGDLVTGRFVTAHEIAGSKGWKLVSFDAKTGQRQWEAAVPRSESGSGPEGLTLSPTRVYVPHWTWLDIFDAKSGKHIETVGVW